MKKIILTYVAILAGVYVVFSLMDMRGSYVIEQKLWKINRQFSLIARDPSVVPEEKFRDVAAQYEHIIKKYPESKLMEGVRLYLGDLYMLKKDYATARVKYGEIVKLSPNKGMAAEATRRIGKTYETQGNWAQAYTIYQSVIQDYPLSKAGLDMPLYLAQYFKMKNDYQNAVDSYDFALKYYKNLSSKQANTNLEFEILRRITECYIDQKRWSEAIGALAEVLNKYAGSKQISFQTTDKVIKTINVIAAFQMNDYDVAIKIYQDFIATHANHPLNQYLQKNIDSFNQMKAKGIKVSNQK